MSWMYGIAFLASLMLSLLLTPLVKKLAPLLGAVDKPNERKVHEKAMPRLGGVAIFASFSVTYVGIVCFTDAVATNVGYALLFGGGAIVLTGVLDDIFELPPKAKLFGQLVGATIAIYFGLWVQVLSLPFMDEPIHIGWLGIPLTIFWIIALTNAVNLIDGLDGLAGGVSAISALALFIVSLSLGNVMIAMMLVIFAGAILGFLKYNFHPASIFMGDSGSLFLGFALASISLLELKEVTMVSLIIPVLILAVPIVDTLYAIIRRKLSNRPISAADKQHVHHRLLALGFSHRTTVLIIYGISIVFATLGILSTQAALWMLGLFLLFYLLFFEIFAESIGMMHKEHRPILLIYDKVKALFRTK